MRDRGARIFSLLLVAFVIGLCGPVPVTDAAPLLLTAITPDVSVAEECSPAAAAEIGLPAPLEPTAITADLTDLFRTTVDRARSHPGSATYVRHRYPDVRTSRAPPRA